MFGFLVFWVVGFLGCRFFGYLGEFSVGGVSVFWVRVFWVRVRFLGEGLLG